jgi:hypothetical protein
MTLSISADDPPDQAKCLEARLIAGDPRNTAEVWGGLHDAEQLGYPWPPVDPLIMSIPGNGVTADTDAGQH